MTKQYTTDARHQIPGCGLEMTMIQIQLSNIAGVTQYNEQVCHDDLVITWNCGKLESPGLKIIQLLDVVSIALWGSRRTREPPGVIAGGVCLGIHSALVE